MIGENEDIQIWEKNLLNAIKDFSDIDFQRRAWLGKDPQYISSFSEVICVLYDDNNFDRYIKYLESIRRDDDLKNLMSELDQIINEYEEAETDEFILTDPKWIEITNKAKEIYLYWTKKFF